MPRLSKASGFQDLHLGQQLFLVEVQVGPKMLIILGKTGLGQNIMVRRVDHPRQ